MIAGARYSEFFRKSDIAFGLLIFFVAATLIGGLVLVSAKEDPNDPTVSQRTRGDKSPIGGSGDHSMTSGGDISGDLIQSKGDVFKEVHHHHYPSLAAQPAPDRSRQPSKLVIHSANYMAITGEGKPYDVAECLRQMIEGDRLDLDIENHNFKTKDGHNYVPDDPKRGTKKRLQITYSYDGGSQFTTEKLEGSRIELPENRAVLSKPRLNIVRLDKTLASENGEFWTERLNVPGGDAVWVVRIENFLDTPYLESDVAARLDFKNKSGKEWFVGRAYWLEKQANTTYIGVGKRESVLLGMPGNGRWAYYDNPLDIEQIPIYLGRPPIPRIRKRMTQQNLPLDGGVECRLTIYSAATGIRLAECMYQIEHTDDGDIRVKI